MYWHVITRFELLNFKIKIDPAFIDPFVGHLHALIELVWFDIKLDFLLLHLNSLSIHKNNLSISYKDRSQSPPQKILDSTLVRKQK